MRKEEQSFLLCKRISPAQSKADQRGGRMCNLTERLPRGWQQVCRKARMDPASTLPCALFLSPNGRTFRTKKDVDDYEVILEEGRRMKMQKKQVRRKQEKLRWKQEEQV